MENKKSKQNKVVSWIKTLKLDHPTPILTAVYLTEAISSLTRNSPQKSRLISYFLVDEKLKKNSLYMVKIKNN